MNRTTTTIPGLLLAGLLPALQPQSLAAAPQAPAAPAVQLNIGAQSLAEALRQFAHQSGLQLVFRAGDIDPKLRAPALSGAYRPEAALDQLLANSRLSYRFVNARTVAIRPEAAADARKTALEPDSIAGLQLAQSAGPAADDSARVEPAQQSTERSGSAAPEEEGELLVTGSRLRAADRTAPVLVIDRELIERRGFSTVEDIVRSLPQNLATMNAARSVTQPVGGDGLPIGPAAQGEVTVNLRGISQSATLVLVDGRRTAGSAGFSGSAVNLASIPVASIERVEVLSDSAAAVYGSDAIAGVVNIVLRKDYRGASSSVRLEDAANGGDKRAFDQVFGFGWNGGNLTTTLSVSSTEPINTARTGYTTRDLRSQGGYDQREFTYVQPGYIYRANFTELGTLPAGYDGTEAWTLANLSPQNAQPGNYIRRDQSSETDTRAAYVTVRQALTPHSEASFGLRYSHDEVKAAGAPPLMYVGVSATNQFNRLGVPLYVTYVPLYEIDNGLLPLATSSNKLESLEFDAGLRFDLPIRDWRADVSAVHGFSKSRSLAEGYASNLGNGVTIPDNVNVIGNGTVQNSQYFLDAYDVSSNYTHRKTTLSGLTASVEGSLGRLPAGAVRGAAGAEYRLEGLAFGGGDYIARQRLADFRPDRTIAAVFAETRLPLFSSLSATLQGRWEQYRIESTSASVDGATFDRLSPRVGLAWTATPQLLLRASWGQSFKAPNLTSMVVVEQIATVASTLLDPIQNVRVPVFRDNIANPDLKPETGDTITAGLDWNPSQLPGVDLSLTYSRTLFDNRIIGSVLTAGGLGITGVLANPDAFPGVAVRDPVTNRLLRVRAFPFNVASVQVDALDVDLKFSQDHAWGRLTAGLQGAYTLKYEEQAVKLLPATRLEGTTYSDRIVGVMSLGWSRGRYGADLYGNYVGAYLNTEIVQALFSFSVTPQPVRSRTTWDLTGYYSFGSGWKLSGGVRNLFDEPFPFHQGFAGPYDTRRVDLRGRMMQIEVRKDFSF